MLSVATWRVAVTGVLEFRTTLPGRSQVAALPVVGTGATEQLSATWPVKPWVDESVRTSLAVCPAVESESELLAAVKVNPGPAVTCSGTCVDWFCEPFVPVTMMV